MTVTTAPAPWSEVTTVRRRVPAVLVAVLLLAAATVLANRVLPGWAYPLCGAVTATALILLARLSGLRLSAIGLGRRHFRRSAVVGLIGLALVLTGFGVAMAVPSLRILFQDGRVGSPGFGQLMWLALLRIPLGTVLLEEVAFRGVLPALLGAGERWRWGPVLGAAGLFGLWHLLPSLALEQNAAVHATFGGLPLAVVSLLAMLAATGAGVFLYWWRHSGRGLLAPMMVHLATNSGGLVFAWLLLAH
ncbi:CPBP family intramembrane glutamic endopeptidase [Amycolatopsis alkalitolerans]|uniref:CPBP family intramembrane metalloprotease n=1 Tax=Amycolatopsis alkalitolerans TaxID=2547244 RepID=A0A5C4M3K7_9PSEU|nr:CPBP family intramembrane glutamic endopeptidase [Amycolatopsis alkalitolerans]TNC25744.1 CPBP family intramembrane metalloprotease [Amycolatopsis alkalitolerans]